MKKLFCYTSPKLRSLKINIKKIFVLFFKNFIIFLILLNITACEKSVIQKKKHNKKSVKIEKNTQKKFVIVKKNEHNKKSTETEKNAQQKLVTVEKNERNKKYAETEKNTQQKSVDELIKKLDGKYEQQHIAIVQLGNIGSDAHRAIPHLIKILSSDYWQKTRIVEALGKMGKKAILPLVTLFSSKNKEIRKHSVNAIIKLGNKALFAVMAQKTEDPNVKVCIAQSLAKLGEDQFSVPQLINLLLDKNRKVKIAAINSLGERKSKVAIPKLIAEINNNDYGVQHSAIEAIGKTGSSAKEAIPHLIKILGSLCDGHAAISLRQIGNASIPFLQKALSHMNPKVRGRVAQVLGRIGSKAKIALPELTLALSDPEPSVRISAAFGIKTIGTHSLDAIASPHASDVILALAKNLFDSVYSVRRSAAKALIAVGKNAKAVMPALIRNLKQEKNDIRSDTLHVLKAIGKDAKTAVPVLIELLSYNLLKKEEILKTLEVIEPMWHEKYKKQIPIVVKKGISINISCPGIAYAGKRIRVTIVITNTSGRNLTGVTVYGSLNPTRLSMFPLKILSGNNNPSISGSSITWHAENLKAGQIKKYNATVLACYKTCFRVTVNTDQNIREEAACCTSWKCGFGLLLECIDTFDPLIVGEETTYIIEVTNQNSTPDYDVKIEAVFPAEISPISASGDTKCMVNGKRVTVIPFPILDYQEKIQWKIRAKAVKAGDSRLKIYLTSEYFKKPVTEEESTHVY